MDIETAINCPGANFLNKSRLSLVDLNDMPADIIDNSEKFSVRITMIGRCKKLQGENRCNLTNEKCIFRDLPEFEKIDYEEESDIDDGRFFGHDDY